MGGESRKDSHGEVEQLGRITQHWTSIRSYWGQAGYAFSAQAGKRRRKIRLHCCLRCRRPGSWHGPGKASRCHCLIPTVTLPPNSKPYYFPYPHQTTSTQNKDGKFACIAACAAGGLGVGMVLERHPDATA